jgi:VanZ family protein
MSAFRSSATPIGAFFVAVVIYASLHPFEGWRNQDIAPWAFLFAPISRYWSIWDVLLNFLGYVPLGLTLTLALVRTYKVSSSWFWAWLLCCALSFVMECMQTYLPSRVPSVVDFALNSLGALLGVWMAHCFERWGWVDAWSHFKKSWFIKPSAMALVLLLVWPLALLFPLKIPFATGQVFWRMKDFLLEWSADSALGWLNELPLMSFSSAQNDWSVLTVTTGLLMPCLLVNTIVSRPIRRFILMSLVLGIGFGVGAVSAGLSFGATHLTSWINQDVLMGTAMAVGLGLLSGAFSIGLSKLMLIVCILVHVVLVNPGHADVYLSQTLLTWEQSKFVRFNGLAQWLGWLWPYVVMIHTLTRLNEQRGFKIRR